RGFLRAAGLAGVAGLAPAWLPGCRTATGPAALASAELPASLAWIKTIDPIAPARAPQLDFSGDQPKLAHKWPRDAAPPSATAMLLKPDETIDVAIVGGGIAGLAAAYLLRHLRPVLLEQAETLGGAARGESWDGLEYGLSGAHLLATESGSALFDAI